MNSSAPIKFASGPYVAIDLEVAKDSNFVHKLAAIRTDSNKKVIFQAHRSSPTDVFRDLDRLTEGATALLGHNARKFDRPHLEAFNPRLKLLQLPIIDTLWLSPLAFPKNPYHHLVKHYKDGGLVRSIQNDPELDARLALQLFRDEVKALHDKHKEAPNLIAAKSFQIPEGVRVTAEVAAIIGWKKKDADPAFHDQLRSEQWEVVIPELSWS